MLRLDVLRVVHDRLLGSGVEWALTGSLGMALQGMPLSPRDVDVQTDPDGAYEIERRLLPFMVRPVAWLESERMRSHLGQARILEVQVEIMGGIQKRLPDGAWEAPVSVVDHRRLTTVEGMTIPVLTLEYELEAYLGLGRLERAGEIRRFLERS